ncbi:hypothetical protein BST42_14600 [Mycolicibacterium rhodesiae]|uniref:STAS domain-containing protein n=1 Tax=Mycolicibacterium rhodesiae TaxID=36814 RepID=A0A1X0IVG7_MYCRH|nr:hypothetical protein BST42_14600 [Mycolicibacterium rhodesiae]
MVVSVQRLVVGDTVVHLAGDLTGGAAAAIQQTLIDQLAQAPPQLIVDLSAVSGIDSDGVAALVSAAAVAGESDNAFCLVDKGAGPVLCALAAERVIDLFEVFSSVGEAVQGWR